MEKFLYEKDCKYTRDDDCLYIRKGKTGNLSAKEFKIFSKIYADELKGITKIMIPPSQNSADGSEEVIINGHDGEFLFSPDNQYDCIMKNELMNGIEEIILHGVNVKNAASFMGMFFRCSNLKRVDFANKNFLCSNGAYAERLTDVSMMFMGCENLEDITLECLKNTERIVDFSMTFYKCKKLKQFDFQTIGTSKIRDLDQAFSECESLENVITHPWNTFESLKSMKGAFCSCDSLEEILLRSDTDAECMDYQGAFMKCKKLKRITMKNFVMTGNCEINAFAAYCPSLEIADLNGISINTLLGAGGLFDRCPKLTCIKAKDGTVLIKKDA